MTSIPTSEIINMENAVNDAGLKIENHLPAVFIAELDIVAKHANVFTMSN